MDGKEIEEDDFGSYYKPKGILLIGRRKKLETSTLLAIDANPKRLRRLMSYFHGIEVLTYDDLIERAKNALNNLRK